MRQEPDRLTVRGLRARGRHGVLAAERSLGQEFVVDVELEVDLRAAAASDDLGETVDYGGLATDVVGIVEDDPVDLIETLAQRIADRCLEPERVSAVVVTVHKPQAPVPVPFDDVTVTIRRSRT